MDLVVPPFLFVKKKKNNRRMKGKKKRKQMKWKAWFNNQGYVLSATSINSLH
jgi:hypothetical protein